MIRLIAIALICLAALPARADFGDCMSSDYLRGFGGPGHRGDPTSPTRSITCVIEFEFTVSTPGGERRIRGIRDASADWAFPPGGASEVERGARAAANTLSRLGDYRIDDVTILLLDDTYDPLDAPPDPRGTVAAVTNGIGSPNECLVTSFLLTPDRRAGEVAYATAHEIFHCVQAASLTRAQYMTTVGGGVWWAEGSAELFAALALPDAGDLADRAPAFDRAVAAETPLYGMAYEMAVFFYWFDAKHGTSRLMPFLRGMASSDGAGAQRAAMRAALGDKDWLDFAQSYADRSITHPSGSALSFGSDDGETIEFRNNRSERTTLQPFQVRRGWITYDCGRWENELTPDTANLAMREDGTEDWAEPPDEVDTEEGPDRYRFAAIGTQDGPQAIRLKVERIHSCEPCAGSRELDACLVGVWQMTGGGPIEWMRAQGVPIIHADPGTRIVRFGDDGIYFTQAFPVQLTMQMDDKIAEGVGAALPAAGRWSITEGRLAVCQDMGGMSGTVTMDGITLPVAVAGGGTMVGGYSCSRTTLQTTNDIGHGSPMTTTYSKIGGPVEE